MLKRWHTPVSKQSLRFIKNKLDGKMCGPPRTLGPIRTRYAQKREGRETATPLAEGRMERNSGNNTINKMLPLIYQI